MKFYYGATRNDGRTLYLGDTDDLGNAIRYSDNSGELLRNCRTYIEDQEGRTVVECTLVEGAWTKVWVDEKLMNLYGKAVRN